MTSHNLIIGAYVLLLLAGGLIGYLKAGSKVSVIMAVAFAVPLALCAVDVLQVRFLPEILMAALLAVFGLRLAKTKKFMPSGLMLLSTAIALLLCLLPKP